MADLQGTRQYLPTLIHASLSPSIKFFSTSRIESLDQRLIAITRLTTNCAGSDRLIGNGSNDYLYGGAGDDILIGGAGNDLLYGQAGADIFVLASGNGNDSIFDFKDGTDKLGLFGGLTYGALTIFGSGNKTSIRLTSTNETLATLSGINPSLITESDFISVL